MISIPALRPEDVGKPLSATPSEKPKKSFWRRLSRDDDQKFVMKKVTRGDYLKYYAKDEDRNYVGTEDPADDCILKVEELVKWRCGNAGVGDGWKNELDGQSMTSTLFEETGKANVKTSMKVVR